MYCRRLVDELRRSEQEHSLVQAQVTRLSESGLRAQSLRSENTRLEAEAAMLREQAAVAQKSRDELATVSQDLMRSITQLRQQKEELAQELSQSHHANVAQDSQSFALKVAELRTSNELMSVELQRRHSDSLPTSGSASGSGAAGGAARAAQSQSFDGLAAEQRHEDRHATAQHADFSWQQVNTSVHSASERTDAVAHRSAKLLSSSLDSDLARSEREHPTQQLTRSKVGDGTHSARWGAERSESSERGTHSAAASIPHSSSHAARSAMARATDSSSTPPRGHGIELDLTGDGAPLRPPFLSFLMSPGRAGVEILQADSNHDIIGEEQRF